MPRISTAFLIAVLSLVPAALAGPASAFVQMAETQDGAAIAPGQRDAAGPSQDHIKEMFFDAARAGRYDLLDGLIQSGMKPDERDPHGYTALILAAYNGQAKTVDFLIQKGANPCAADPKGNMMAAMFGRTDVVKMLLVNGANPELKDQAGNTAVSLAQQQANPQMVTLLTQSTKGP